MSVAVATYRRFDASLLFSVNPLIDSQPLTVVGAASGPGQIEIYERGGNAHDFDDRIVITKYTDARGVWGIARHSRRDQSWSLASLSEIMQVVRNAADCTSIDEWCKLLGPSDEERLEDSFSA